MITFLKKYANDSFEKLVNEIQWFDLPFRLKAIFSKLPSGGDSRPYKVYTALLTQSETDAPVATVLENTLGGEVVWSREGVGVYLATLTGAFPTNNRQVFIGTVKTWDGTNGGFVEGDEYVGDNNSIQFQGFDRNAVQVDTFTNLAIEIRVYN